ncbi:MAG: glycine cleavage system aminomethyltransferase GcvT [Phycisphaeraceae bacterium]|nr:glycine cleavage system aminomethyltransferase GcvT [Phycisphaeraceae bacterium]
MADLHKTPFHSFHADHGAHFVEFAGWEMPIRYGSIQDEHEQVRQRAGLFDVSHMGRIHFTGRHARRLLERALTRRVSDMEPGQCRYALICNEAGGTIDDVLVYRYPDHWMLVVNAANRKDALAHLQNVAETDDLTVEIDDVTFETAMIALQGPDVMDRIGKFSQEVPGLKRYRFCEKSLMVLKMTISRTGYTGEDGVEVILPAKQAAMAVRLLISQGGGNGDDPTEGIQPVGLGARDTLRMEAGMPLYGHELDRETDPLSAGLTFAVDLDKHDHDNGERFVGQAALEQIQADGPTRKLVGLKLDGRRTPRQGQTVIVGDDQGTVTSGCLSPTLGHPIAMAYVPAEHAEAGTAVEVDLGRKQIEGEIVSLPFYKR